MYKWIPLVLVGLASCSDTPGPTAGCRKNAECGGGEVCVDGECRAVCVVDGDCGEGETCATDGTCVIPAADRPIIDGVDGDGAVDSGPSDPLGTRASHHLRSSIHIL